jgi:AcrR family transcriptional regulator
VAAVSRHSSRRVPRGAEPAPRLRLTRLSSTVIEGTLSAPASGGPEPAGSIAVMAEFAEALILAGAAPGDAGAPSPRPTVTSLAVERVGEIAGGVLCGLARRVAQNGTRQLFQVEIRQAGDDRVAALVTAQVEGVIAERARAGRDCGAPGPNAGGDAEPPVAPRSAGGAGAAASRLRHLVDAASRVFATSGYGNASMREVATEAGMPIATMYQYVSGKEQLLLCVFETYMSEILEALDRVNDTSASPRERLRSCIGATLSLYDKYRAQIRLIHQEGRALGAENRRRVRSLARSTRRIWEGILNDGVEQGEFRCTNPAITASLVPVLCSTWVLRRRALGDHSLEELRDAIVEVLESGLAVGSVAGSARPRRRP